VDAPAHRMLREVAGEFLATKPRENWRHIVNVFGEWWGWGKDPADFQRPDFRAFGKHVAPLWLRPRTEHNYLNQVCTFLRATGRVVLVADTEQDPTLRRAMAVVPNTLVLADWSATHVQGNRGLTSDRSCSAGLLAQAAWRLAANCGVRES